MWIGATDSNIEGTWMWVAPSYRRASASSILWSPGEPNQAFSNEDCAFISEWNALTYDAGCNLSYHGLCEKIIN